MAKIETDTKKIRMTIRKLQSYRKEWASQIRRDWYHKQEGAREILFALYEISGNTILALEASAKGNFREKIAIKLVKQKLEQLIISQNFHNYDILGQEEMCFIVTSETKDHIRIMLEALDDLTA